MEEIHLDRGKIRSVVYGDSIVDMAKTRLN
jgi:hypothetical protein